jgi:hypothetical protein
MRSLVLFFMLMLGTMSVAAGINPLGPRSHECVKIEIQNQYPNFSHLLLGEVLVFATDAANFEYLIYARKEDSGPIVDRLFVIVREGAFALATFYAGTSKGEKIDLNRCFE